LSLSFHVVNKNYPVKQEMFPDKLRAIRIEASLSREKLAAHLRVSKSAVSNWEQGRGFPCSKNLKKLDSLFE
jgi:DNA-binding transcriptional regulator YiaG